MYVWYKGKTWIDTGLKDYMGRHILTNWRDTSRGILANRVRPCSEKDVEAIEKFRRENA